MKNRILYILTIGLVLSFSNSKAGNPDTLSLNDYLGLFDNNFTTEFNFGWYHYETKNAMKFSLAENKQLNGCKIKLNNGSILSPEIYGSAYSHRKFCEHLFWLVYLTEGESGNSFWLCVLNTKNKTVSKSYQLANAFGDQGDWAYRYGEFENDSTYNYLFVYGNTEGTLDSISGQDRIIHNGELLELKKRKLK